MGFLRIAQLLNIPDRNTEFSRKQFSFFREKKRKIIGSKLNETEWVPTFFVHVIFKIVMLSVKSHSIIVCTNLNFSERCLGINLLKYGVKMLYDFSLRIITRPSELILRPEHKQKDTWMG